ncbi:unnamed protein product [Phyllotreta striolata]|uniref:Protein transport protein sec16 n=1 Tax=Phyllotreta striolata TaxID=444603 RepID=A0A9N9THH9_PHYSR|nr:unnamed protein product [Phyllotreta striolata]
MSWMKRRGPNNASPAPVPSVPMYNPNQHSNVHENQWQNQPVQNNWYPPQQTEYQQAVPKPEPSQPQQNYWQQPYNPVPYNQNNQQYSQQQYPAYNNPQNNTGYEQQNYGNMQYNQLNNQNNIYGTHGAQPQAQSDGDAWNWGWGDEDNSNMQHATQESTTSVNQPAAQLETTLTNETWNWGVEESKNPPAPKEEPIDYQQQFPKMGLMPKPAQKSALEVDASKPNAVQDHLTVSGKRGKLETPQWSTESQMSQESSDDILHTSESDKSHMMSRSSTISHSPISGHDLAPHVAEEAPAKGEFYENKEIVSNIRPDSAPKNVPPPLLPSASSNLDDSKNPYKRNAGLSQVAANRFRSTNITPPDTRQTLFKTSLNYQLGNLETPPDNVEHPEPLASHTQKIKPVSQRPDNNEAPINDRNQYLETGHLSEGNYNDTQDESTNSRQDLRNSFDLQESVEGTGDALPPPGLRRMVPGQLEQSENPGKPVNFTDEPPPGLSRMVLGQTEATPSNQLGAVSQNENAAQFDTSGPPEGLRRMVPGESSSPELPMRQSRKENDSEPEFNQLGQHSSQPRSATIGADTPPTVSNSTTAQNASSTIGYSRLENGSSNSQSRGSSKEPESNHRRDSIEGEPQDGDVSNITNSVRDMTVGENLTDGHASNNSLPEHPQRRHSRQESSESDREFRKPPRGPSRDKRSSEKSRRDRDKDRDKSRRERDSRYSPDSRYERDKKYERRRYKDRRYEEDTDYFSDKEKERRNYDDKDADYERKYSSLRKEKDKDRRRRDARDPRDYRREYYYGNRYDDYENDQRSRPSSRTDSMHESYRGSRPVEKDERDGRRNRDREREKYRSRRDQRDVYNPYQAYGFDQYNPYLQQYQYYENLRRTNPQAYAEWYRKYYQQATAQTPSYGGEDRASVHSGRSSANDELAKDRYTRQSFYSQMSASHLGGYYRDTHTHSVTGGHYALDASSYSRPFDHTDSSLNLEDTTLASHRLTPAKFATAHAKASLAAGKLLRVLPHYPIDGQPATVEIYNAQALLLDDDEFKELSQFPGPLVKGATHKKTVIEYCESKIRNAIAERRIVDVESYVLMWELLILLIRQNGMVVGADIAELLLKSKRELPPVRPSSTVSSIGSQSGEANPSSEGGNAVSDNAGSVHSILKEEEITNKFREFLLYGSGKEALEWAMKHNLWGHALFLASKLDKRTYANVMMRFANGLTMNDPLQTLYQLLSGKIPAAVTCVSDEKWGDWRPHLAMILSNTSQRPEINCKAITVLGDTLRNRGSLYAAQFCYLMAEVGFGKYNDPEARLVLLGADHSKPHHKFASSEAIHMTEIYEFACGLNDSGFIIPHFQVYKYLLATRLVDRGLVEKSLAYLEKISSFIVSNPTLVEASFVDNVYNMADKLKFNDLVGDVEDETEFGSILETSRPDISWLKDLKAVQDDFQNGLIPQQTINPAQNYGTGSFEAEQLPPTYESTEQDTWQQQYEQQQYQQNVQQQPWQPEQVQQNVQDYQDNQQLQQPIEFNQNQYQDQQNYWPNYQQLDQVNQYNQERVDQQNIYSSDAQTEDLPQPQITLPNQPNAYEEESQHDKGEQKPSVPAKPQGTPAEPEKSQSTGWFGGIFSKLALKPKNQMKLPDDKNPKIVWDEAKKRWMNLDNDPDDPANEFKPPPKLSDLMPKMNTMQPQAQSTPQQSPAAPNPAAFDPNKTVTANGGPAETANLARPVPGGNMFKLQKGRNLKNSYIDVFNAGGAKPANSSGPASLPAMSQAAPSAPQMNFFVPQQVADANAPADFLTPGGVPFMGEPQMSRWSSASSLSKEVQYYMQPKSKPKFHLR